MKLAIVTVALSLGGAGFAAMNLNDLRRAAPLTTLPPLALAVERSELGGVQDDGMEATLNFLWKLSDLLDRDFLAARSALEAQLDVEVRLADAAGVEAEDVGHHLLKVGATARGLAEIDRCEYELRRAAGLSSQLVLERGRQESIAVNAGLYEDFNGRVTRAVEHLERLEDLSAEGADQWANWVEALEVERLGLNLLWGVAGDRSFTSDLLRVDAGKAVSESDLERLGKEELDRWRTR